MRPTLMLCALALMGRGAAAHRCPSGHQSEGCSFMNGCNKGDYHQHCGWGRYRCCKASAGRFATGGSGQGTCFKGSFSTTRASKCTACNAVRPLPRARTHAHWPPTRAAHARHTNTHTHTCKYTVWRTRRTAVPYNMHACVASDHGVCARAHAQPWGAPEFYA